MTPAEMDALYPNMNPLMSRLVRDATAWLSGSWTLDELERGKRWVVPLDQTRGEILVDYFSGLGWSTTGVYGPANVLLTFMSSTV